MKLIVTVFWDGGDFSDTYYHTLPDGDANNMQLWARAEARTWFEVGYHLITESGGVDIIAPSRLSGLYVDEVRE